MPMPVSTTSSRTRKSIAIDVPSDVTRKRHFAAVGELHGIAAEVDEHLAQPNHVDANARQRLAGESHSSSMFFVEARAASISAVCSTSSTRSHSTGASCSRPASIFEKSSTSSTIASNESAER